MNVSEFARTTLFIIGALTILIVLSPILAGAVFSSILPIMFFGFFYGRKIRKLQKEIQEEKAKMTNVAEESYGNIRTVKAFSNEQAEIVKFEEFNNKVYDISKVKAIWGGFFIFTVMFMLFGAMAGIMYLSGILYQRGEINIGIITSFLFYMAMLLFNFARAASVFGEVMAILGASDKVVELIQYKA